MFCNGNNVSGEPVRNQKTDKKGKELRKKTVLLLLDCFPESVSGNQPLVMSQGHPRYFWWSLQTELKCQYHAKLFHQWFVSMCRYVLHKTPQKSEKWKPFTCFVRSTFLEHCVCSQDNIQTLSARSCWRGFCHQKTHWLWSRCHRRRQWGKAEFAD